MFYHFREPLLGRQRSHREYFQHQHGRVKQIRFEQTFVDVECNNHGGPVNFRYRRTEHKKTRRKNRIKRLAQASGNDCRHNSVVCRLTSARKPTAAEITTRSFPTDTGWNNETDDFKTSVFLFFSLFQWIYSFIHMIIN